MIILGPLLAENDAASAGISGYAVGWIALALINAGIAQGKNRRGLTWFLLSLLLGPVATFLMVVTTDPPRRDRL